MLSERLKIAMQLAGVKQVDLAKACGVKPPSVNGWLSGKSKFLRGENLLAAARVLQVNEEWLATGKGPMKPELDNPQQSDLSERIAQARARQQYIVNLTNVEPATIKGSVPLVSWVQAGDFSEAIDLYQPGHAEEWIDTTVAIKQHTFALRVFNDSMEPDFPPGTILIVEPEMDALPGDYVIAKNGDNEATFKQLIRDGSDLYLKPLNPRYPMKKVDDKVRIIGVVRSAERKFR